jgi:hypothetical protein
MEITIEKTVRSAVLHPKSLFDWAIGQGADKELFEEPKYEFDPNEYRRNFNGWTIGSTFKKDGEGDFPVYARIELGGTVYVYGHFIEPADDWGLIQNWFHEQTDMALGELMMTTQTVTVALGVQVDLPATAEKFGVDFHPESFPAVVFKSDNDLLNKENKQSTIMLFGSGRILFTMLYGNIQIPGDIAKFLEMVNKIASDLVVSEQ